MSGVKLDSGPDTSSQRQHDDNETTTSDALTTTTTSQNPMSNLLSLGALDMIIPGYSSFAHFFSAQTGIDVTSLVKLATLIYAANRLYDWFINGPIAAWISEQIYTSMRINYSEEIYDSLIAWYYDIIAKGKTRLQRICSDLDSDDEDEEEEDDLDRATKVNYDDLTIFGLPSAQTRTFDYSAWKADLPPTFQPDYGMYSFWYKRRYYTMTRGRSVAAESDHYRSSREFLTLSCVSRSIQPIKDLLQDVIRYTINKRAAKTRVFICSGEEHDFYWSGASSKYARPLSTVILDDEQKNMIVNDVNSFLHPLSQKWYRARAIPYRRGYLFHGPPGTGKTSLSLALAGIFRFDLYTVSLNDTSMTEAGLAQLFRYLPKRCIVLLEDIDDAGLKRDSRDIARNSSKDDAPPAGISMSGLLNVIDGVGSQEGRILIMTTNHPENLDEAMLRSGRVDVKIRFTYARHDQIKALYMRMYEIDVNAGHLMPGPFDDEDTKPPATTANPSESPDLSKTWRTPRTAGQESIARSEAINVRLRQLAESFADRIPDEQIAPSDIQGYLLRYKTQPREAVEHVEDFVRTNLEEREAQRVRKETEAAEKAAAEVKRLEDAKRADEAAQAALVRTASGIVPGTPTTPMIASPLLPSTPVASREVRVQDTPLSIPVGTTLLKIEVKASDASLQAQNGEEKTSVSSEVKADQALVKKEDSTTADATRGHDSPQEAPA